MLRIRSQRKYRGSWDSYRYGSSVKPTLPPLFKGKRRDAAIDDTMAVLETFRLSKFEREGDCRSGIRSTLCLRGHSWGIADATAADVVKEALRRIGAERPPWYMGQPEYAEGRERCLRCSKFVAETDRADGRRFCSKECARIYKVMLAYEPQDFRPHARDCLACGKTFCVPRTAPNKKYCSRKCAGHGEPLKPQNCEWCGTEFQPKRSGLRFCGRNCFSLFNIQNYRDTHPERSCVICGTTFRPGQALQEVCSKVCMRRRTTLKAKERYDPAKAAAAYQRKKARRAAASGFICEAAE